MGAVQIPATKVVPSVGAILIIMTLQGQQNALQNSRPVDGQWPANTFSIDSS